MNNKTQLNNNTIISDIVPQRQSKWKNVIRVCIIVFLFLLLTISYVSMFSTGNIRRGVGGRFIGVLDVEDFYGANSGDLIAIEKVSKIRDLKIDDIIVYHLNGDVGSVKVTSIDYANKVIKASTKASTSINLTFELVIGRQGAKVPVMGYLFGFVSSTIGAVIISIVLLSYLYYLTFSRINKEDTQKGKQLLERYKIEKYEAKARKKLLEEFRRADGFSPEDSNIIDGSMGDNIIELLSYTKTNDATDVTQTYKYILEKVHRTYMTRPTLSKHERTRISNVIEMAPIVDVFDESMTYKLIDLLLHKSLVEFDISGFEKLAIKFLSKNISSSDLENFGGFLYTLLNKNTKMKNSSTLRIVYAYNAKVNTFEVEKFENIHKIAQTLLNLCKN